MALISIGLITLTTVTGFLLYVVFACVKFFLKFREQSQALKHFPCDPRHWLLGNLDKYPGPTEAGLTWMKAKADLSPEGLGVVWFGPFFPALHVFNPDYVKQILKTSG